MGESLSTIINDACNAASTRDRVFPDMILAKYFGFSDANPYKKESVRARRTLFRNMMQQIKKLEEKVELAEALHPLDPKATPEFKPCFLKPRFVTGEALDFGMMVKGLTEPVHEISYLQDGVVQIWDRSHHCLRLDSSNMFSLKHQGSKLERLIESMIDDPDIKSKYVEELIEIKEDMEKQDGKQG